MVRALSDPQDGSHSFRDIVHQYCKGHPWARFGIDLCIGREADQPITQRQMMFAPFYLMDAFDGTYIFTDTYFRPLVKTKEKIIDVTPEPDESDWMPTFIYTDSRCHNLWYPPENRIMGDRPCSFWHGRYRGMHPRLPRPLLPTPGSQFQFPVIGLPSGATSFPSLHCILCPKREEMLVLDLESSCFNTFYSAFSCNSAKI